MAPLAFFLPAATGQRFCLFHPAAAAAAKGVVLYLHPFAEEMNKSRRMAALQAKALAAANYAVLQMDLHGCGDSSGDFGDAIWASWQDDVALACAWLREQSSAPLWLWGLRAGCLLAAEAAPALPEPPNFLFWQPATTGKQHLQQFLRLKMAGELLSGNAKGTMEALRKELGAGKAVEIAGYTLSAGLANGMEKAELLPRSAPARLVWIELSSRPEATLSPASRKYLGEWQKAGHATADAVVTGPAFWQTTEIEEAPALLAATLTALEAGH